MEWPPQSPDLNPIENLWGIVKHRVYDYVESPNNPNVLWERTKAVWESISPDICRNLVRSMPERLRQVIKARGGYTKY